MSASGSTHADTNQVQRMVVARRLIKEAESFSHLNDSIPREEQKTYRDAGAPAKS